MMSKEGKISLFDPNALNSMEFTGYALTMAVAELLDNSLDEDSTDIKIVMTVAKVLVRHNSNNKVVKLAVIDNGNGMTPEVLQKA
jgi:DNA topoisomerase VI subunit B